MSFVANSPFIVLASRRYKDCAAHMISASIVISFIAALMRHSLNAPFIIAVFAELDVVFGRRGRQSFPQALKDVSRRR